LSHRAQPPERKTNLHRVHRGPSTKFTENSRGLPQIIRTGDFGEEGAKFGGVFFAAAGFDAAGYVHGVGPDGEDGFGDIFRGEATGEKDGISSGEAFCDLPVGEAASATITFRSCFGGFGVKKK